MLSTSPSTVRGFSVPAELYEAAFAPVVAFAVPAVDLPPLTAAVFFAFVHLFKIDIFRFRFVLPPGHDHLLKLVNC